MFSTLEAWDALEGARVLDLFAGSGALGLEAASRGATEVDFVEKHPPAATIVKTNVQTVLKSVARDATPQLRVHRATASSFLQEGGGGWDLVFIDPPYDFNSESLTAILVDLAPLLRDRAIVMVERSSRVAPPEWPESLAELKTKRYGETTLYWAESLSD